LRLVHETTEDLDWLQGLLDESNARGGAHLRSIFTEERRLRAREVSELLMGMQLLVLGTVTAKGEPRVAPVDGHFHRARFYFGSSPDSARFTHLRARPAVSATHIRGEELAVVIHGTAAILDMRAPENVGFKEQMKETYGARPDFMAYLDQHFGGDWEGWFSGPTYARIDPTSMFTFRMEG
jgi:general stress protein 26